MDESKDNKKDIAKLVKESIAGSAAGILIISFILGFAGGLAGYYVAPIISNNSSFFQNSKVQLSSEEDIQNDNDNSYNPIIDAESAVMSTVDSSINSVVSVIATKDLPIIEKFPFSPFGELFQVPQYVERGTETRQVSAGTGFVVAKNIIVTNKHVVADLEADYTVVDYSGEKLQAEVIAKDPVEDLAFLRVEGLSIDPLPLGESGNVKRGQFVITIGNALGEFDNTVSLGVVSGLSRTLTASGSEGSEVLREVIQTDAAVNSGNSGGPLLNLSGEVIGVNVARAVNADNIGFAIPIDRIKGSLKQITATGQVKYPFLGVRYVIINPELQDINDLPFDYGALVVRGDSFQELAVAPGSAADKAGIVENDIILEINEEKISKENPLSNVIAKYQPGETIQIKVYHRGETNIVDVTLGERAL